jgi:hypothetical protein
VTPPERQDLFEAARERILARFASTPSTASSSTRS